MAVIVTGGAGFIGSHLVDALHARGDDVLAVDDLSKGKASGSRRRSTSATCATPAGRHLRRPPARVVLHLAAQADVRLSVSDPGRTPP